MIDFDYIAEKVIASGDTVKNLEISLTGYARKCSMTLEDYFNESS
jgi:hypothetical protein